MHTTTRSLLITFVAAALTGCGDASAGVADGAPDRAPALATPPGTIVDSVRPIAEELRRFRAGLAAPARLEGGASSRVALVADFMRAARASDTTALRRMALTRAEYAWLVYPESPLAAPPYNQPPGLAWMLLQQASNTGATRVLDPARGAVTWRHVGDRCAQPPLREGGNRFWRGCEVRVARAAGDTTWARLFGAIVERDGHFKFVGYDNGF